MLSLLLFLKENKNQFRNMKQFKSALKVFFIYVFYSLDDI